MGLTEFDSLQFQPQLQLNHQQQTGIEKDEVLVTSLFCRMF